MLLAKLVSRDRALGSAPQLPMRIRMPPLHANIDARSGVWRDGGSTVRGWSGKDERRKAHPIMRITIPLQGGWWRNETTTRGEGTITYVLVGLAIGKRSMSDCSGAEF